MTAATLSPTATREVEAAARWIRRDSQAAARRFRDVVSNALELLGDYPEAGVRREEMAPERYRLLLLQGFPYLMVYDAVHRPPRVLRIIHAARDLPELLRDL
ncbi:MAG: type II toxin-antitoxin system RelE/ParE family toxin [Caulobacteraceae bacterium]|nr:type II toxin-antitoxin system RelE/ParE family toxin [Caulobacteraceae bacterium]